MATIGSVTKHDDGRYEGELRTLSIRAEVAILPVTDKVSPNQPDYRVLSQGIEIGAGWVRKGQSSGKDYVSLSIAAPEFGARSVIDRFAQVEPKVLLAIDGYRYGGNDHDRSETVAAIADEIPSLARVVRSACSLAGCSPSTCRGAGACT